MLSDERLVETFEEHFLANYEPADLADIIAGLRAVEAAVRADMQPREWEPVKWHELSADDENGDPTGDTIRLSWDDGTVLIGRLTVPSVGSGHHQVCRMQTVFGGDTYVWPHGAMLTRKVTPSIPNQQGAEQK